MTISPELLSRSNHACELCGAASEALTGYSIPPEKESESTNQVALCEYCHQSIVDKNFSDTNHWRCLSGSIWSEVSAVQVLSYKILHQLRAEDWAAEAMESVGLDETLIDRALAEENAAAGIIVHKDAYGVVLEQGDTVILTQNLNVKGANFIAPKGTTVRKIRLVPDNAEQIEGKIEGDTIVILTKYVRKSS